MPLGGVLVVPYCGSQGVCFLGQYQSLKSIRLHNIGLGTTNENAGATGLHLVPLTLAAF